MKNIPAICLLLLMSFTAVAQTTAHVDKKTKEFLILSNSKTDFRIIGYQFPNVSTKKMICFSSYSGDVRDNFYKCPLGSYFDTGLLREGDRIIYLGPAGSFAKMSYVSAQGKKTIFYIPKTSFTIR